MIAEFLDLAGGWNFRDSWIAATAALAAMACAIPGCFLFLRRQSMMGDALSHTALPGIVAALLLANWLRLGGWLDDVSYPAAQQAMMFGGAIAVGLLTAFLTEWIQKLGHVEAGAALGVVFTSLFAVGLLLIRVAADNVHIDPDCVFHGMLETAGLSSRGEMPAAAKTNGVALLINLALLLLFYKELKLSTFDPELATAQGINARAMHYGLMAVTAMTLVSAFESVGVVLVIALLIVPAATASMLTDRMGCMLVLSLVIAAVSSVLGHLFAITLPAMLFPRLGFADVRDASTAGMIAGTCGLLFVLSVLFGPRKGLVSRLASRARLAVRIASDDLLGLLYRLEESRLAGETREAPRLVARQLGIGRIASRLSVLRLIRAGQIVSDSAGYHLTDSGRQAAGVLVRSHRLWESYLAKYFRLPDSHLHESAARVEHFLNPEIRAELESDLDTPKADPHGQVIPDEESRP
jgi:manganese/zinc/iron transport system permease protein